MKHCVRSILIACALALACASPASWAASTIKHVIVIAMENKDARKANSLSTSYIYGNLKRAPYINKELMPQAAWAADFADELPGEDSEPHYIWLEAGTNEFADTSFHCDSDPLHKCSKKHPRNWTASKEHLTAQIESADPPLRWMTYQEGLDSKHTGACPIHSSGLYAAKHNPFVFFADVAGNPPDEKNQHCIAHTRDFKDLAADLAAGNIANYVFITPNLCNDMHGHAKCPANSIKTGDEFLRALMPQLITWAAANHAVIFITWDESKQTANMPFIAVGTGVRKNFESKAHFTHSSIIKTVEEIFALPVLAKVRDAEDLSDMFENGSLP